MRRILTAAAIIAVPVLVILAIMQPKPLPMCVQQAKTQLSPSECISKTILNADSFKNDCLGLSFQSAAPFLFYSEPYKAPFINFAVPKANYSIKVLAFQNPYPHIATPESQKVFLAAAKKNLLMTNPKAKITKEEIISFSGVPAIYIAANNKGMIERRYYFINRGRWVELTLASKDVNFTKNIKPAQEALLKTIRLY